MQRWHNIAMVLALLIGGHAVKAATPLQSLRLVPDITVTLDGTTVPGGRVAEDDLAGNVSLVALPGLDSAAHIDAYQLLPNGDQLLSFDVSLTLPGDLVARPADVVRLSGTTYSVEFDADAENIPAGVNTDAVSTEDGNLLLSFDTTVTLNGLTIDDEDVVSFNGSSFSMRFDGSAAGINSALDLDAVDSLGDHLLMSFDGSGTVGEVAFDDEDVLEYNPSTGSFELVYNGADRHSALDAADLVGLSAVAVPPTFTPTVPATATPTASNTAPPSTPTDTPLPTLTATAPPTSTSIPSLTATAVPSATASFTATLQPSASPSHTPTETRVPTNSPTVTAIPSGTPSSTPLPSTSPTATALQTSSPTATPVVTPTATATAQASASVTHTVAPTNTATATASMAMTATATPTGTVMCPGDCNGDGEVTVDELILMVNIALDLTPVSACTAGDVDAGGSVTIDEILSAVNRALFGC